MITKDLIHKELEKIPEEHLEELYEVIQRFAQIKLSKPKPGVLSKLSNIKIQGPEDFSSHLDLYLSGEKKIVSD